MKVRKSLLLVKSPRRRSLGFVCHAFISSPRSVGERDRGGEWMRDERTPKDVCGEAIARQDQVISWTTTGEYRVKDSSWNGLNNHVSKIHLNISFRLKEILKNCVIVFPLPHSPQRFSLNKINVIITKTIGVRTKHGPGVHGPPVMDRPVRGQFFCNNEKWTKTEKSAKIREHS